jgi:hypothetical protein
VIKTAKLEKRRVSPNVSPKNQNFYIFPKFFIAEKEKVVLLQPQKQTIVLTI